MRVSATCTWRPAHPAASVRKHPTRVRPSTGSSRPPPAQQERRDQFAVRPKKIVGDGLVLAPRELNLPLVAVGHRDRVCLLRFDDQVLQPCNQVLIDRRSSLSGIRRDDQRATMTLDDELLASTTADQASSLNEPRSTTVVRSGTGRMNSPSAAESNAAARRNDRGPARRPHRPGRHDLRPPRRLGGPLTRDCDRPGPPKDYETGHRRSASPRTGKMSPRQRFPGRPAGIQPTRCARACLRR